MENQKRIEAQVLETVRLRSPGGVRPSEVQVEGTAPGQVQSAALALAARGQVKVGTDWRMRVPAGK